MRTYFLTGILMLAACSTPNKNSGEGDEFSGSDTLMTDQTASGSGTDVQVQPDEKIPGPTITFEEKTEQVGGGQEVLHAITYSVEGSQVEDQVLGHRIPYEGPMGSGEDYNYSYDEEKRVIQVTSTITDWDETNQQDISYSFILFYYLNADATLTEARVYPEASRVYLEAENLQPFSKFDLMIMRNEIFASHGYRFKFKELKDYFDTVRWYTPLYDNVNDALSPIEIANVKIIKSVEDSK